MSSVYVTSATPKVVPLVFESDFKYIDLRPAPTIFDDIYRSERSYLYACDFGHFGRLTVLDRMTGFGYRDIESGYRAADMPWECDFWLASGMIDIRNKIPPEGIEITKLIAYIKANANTIIGGLKDGDEVPFVSE